MHRAPGAHKREGLARFREQAHELVEEFEQHSEPGARVLVLPLPVEALHEPAQVFVQRHQHRCAQVFATLLAEQAALGKKPEAKPAMAKDLQPTKGKDKRRRKDKSDGQPSEPKAEPKAKRKPAKRKREQRDGLDDKIHQYFARGESGSGGGKKPKSGGDLDRWFD